MPLQQPQAPTLTPRAPAGVGYVRAEPGSAPASRRWTARCSAWPCSRTVHSGLAPPSTTPEHEAAILRSVRIRKRRLVQKFFEDRGTHLAAMIAYFALLSFVPLAFLALALLGLYGRADESSFLDRKSVV